MTEVAEPDLPNGEIKELVEEKPKNELQKCFYTLAEKSRFSLPKSKALDIIKVNLGIGELDEDLMKELVVLLPTHMGNWPGWIKYFEGKTKLPMETWYDKFYEYMLYKMKSELKDRRGDADEDEEEEEDEEEGDDDEEEEDEDEDDDDDEEEGEVEPEVGSEDEDDPDE